jgi:hypothetical protein
MAGFEWIGDLNGQKNPIIKKSYIPTATAVERGEPVQFTQGTGVIVHAAPTDFDDPIYGVATEPHDGSTSGRQSGTEIELSMSPTALYRHKLTKVYTLTGGSTSTAVDSSLVPATNHFWKGGYIEIVSCANDSSLNGKRVSISDSTGGSGSLALAETLPAALQAGDTIRLCPGYMAHGHIGYDLDSDAMNVDFHADGGETLEIYDTNPKLMEMTVMFRKYKILS